MPITTAQEMIEAIFEAIPNLSKLPQGRSVGWLPAPGSLAPTMIKAGEPIPFDPYSRVVSIFHDDEVIRVYTLGLVPPEPKPKDWTPSPPMRFTLTKSAPTYVSEIMNLDTMATEMIKEWVMVESDMTSTEAEREKVVAYLEAFVTDMQSAMFNEIIQDIREGVHAEPDDDDDDDLDEPDDIEADPTAAPAVSVVAPAPPPPAPPVSS